MKLYEIPGQLRILEDQIQEAEGEMAPEVEAKLDALEQELASKIEYLAMMKQEAEAEAEGVKREERRLRARRQAAERRAESIAGYIQRSLEAAGKRSVKGDILAVRIQTNSRPSIEWAGSSNHIPPEFRRTTVTLDGTKAYEAWKAGGDEALPAGFKVTQGSHLRVV